jgi:hypothetical protein
MISTMRPDIDLNSTALALSVHPLLVLHSQHHVVGIRRIRRREMRAGDSRGGRRATGRRVGPEERTSVKHPSSRLVVEEV